MSKGRWHGTVHNTTSLTDIDTANLQIWSMYNVQKSEGVYALPVETSD